jgi:hypothetical protein
MRLATYDLSGEREKRGVEVRTDIHAWVQALPKLKRM